MVNATAHHLIVAINVPQSEKVEYLCNAQDREAHEESEETTAVGQEVRLSVQLWAARSDELRLFEENHHARETKPTKNNWWVNEFIININW